MRTEMSKGVNAAKEAVNSPEFHQMADGMKKAINDFESGSSAEGIALLTSYLAPVGDACVDAWNATTRFVRRHPVESSIAVGCLGLLAAYMLMPSRGSKVSSSTKTA